MSHLSEEEQIKLLTDIELELMSDMFNKMTRACQKKCVPAKYKDSELSKGESVCLDRCVAKYIEIHDRVGRKLASQTMKDQEAALKLQGGQLPPQLPK